MRRRSPATRTIGSVEGGMAPAQAVNAAVDPGRSTRRKRPGLKRSSGEPASPASITYRNPRYQWGSDSQVAPAMRRASGGHPG